MNGLEAHLEDELIDRIAVLRNAPDRDPLKAAAGKVGYLEQASYLSRMKDPPLAVSIQPAVRHNGWISHVHSLSKRKEQYSMFTVMTTVMVLVALMFGGGGATVYASQASLPDQALYPLKTASEDFRLSLAGNSQTRLELLLEFTDHRISEFAALKAAGEPAPQETADRLQAEYGLALQLAAGMDDASHALIRNRLQDQERIMQMLQDSIRSGSDPVLEQVQAMIRRHLADLEQGVQDPETFRRRMQFEYREGQPMPLLPASQTPQCTGNSYGPGPGAALGTPSCAECTPVQDGTGPGPGPGPLQYGGTPAAPGCQGAGGEVEPQCTGNSYGPGPGAALGTPSCAECTPVQDGTGPGPGPGPLQYGGTPAAPGGQGAGGEVTPPGGQESGGGQPSDPGNPQPTAEPGGEQYGGGQPGRP